jgi:hypothetical protein
MKTIVMNDETTPINNENQSELDRIISIDLNKM